MSLGPSGVALLRNHHEITAPTTMAMDLTTTQVPAMDESDQMPSYFAKPWKCSFTTNTVDRLV